MCENKTLVQILLEQSQQRIDRFQRKARSSEFDAFIAMGGIIQPPARKSDNRKIEGTFFREIVVVLFVSKLAIMRGTVFIRRNAGTVKENITNRFAQCLRLRKIKETRPETTPLEKRKPKPQL